ncbi:MAG: hypothetical protein IKP71_11540, partial [Candidatus Riflebacteria bacterium]|nr:hypothetical protein [Candidatus Riflebacteria bacterium]
LRAVITAAGGNIDGGLWSNEEGRGYCEIATFSNGIYERTVYNIDKDFISQLSKEDLQNYLISHSILDGCDADLRKGILYGIKVKPNAKITVEFQPNSNHKQFYYSFKGTLNTDLTIKWIEPNVEKYESKTFIVDYNGNDITNRETAYSGLKVSEKTTCNTAYSFSNIDLNLTDITCIDYKHSYNNSNIKEYKGNVKVSLSGMDGTVTQNKTTFVGKWAYKQENQWVVEQPYYYEGDFNVVVSKNNLDFTLNSPVEINVTGEAYDTYADNGKKINTANIKNVSVIINKLTKPASGKLEDYIIDDAGAHVELEASAVDPVIMIGNLEIAFCKAKIDVTGLKYDYKWEPTSDYYFQGVRNEEYIQEEIELRKKCFGNAKATIEAEETKNDVTIKGNCDINSKTAYLKLVNNGNIIVKDNSSEDKVLEFNFKTVDINGTNVDVLADNKCEGAVLNVKGVEKDGTISERTYKVVNGKLVLDSSKDKQVPNLPDVEIPSLPEGLSNDSNSIDVAVSEGNPTNELPMNGSDESLKVGQNGDLMVASYDRKPKNGKKIETKISAKNKIITCVTFYGNNEFTLLFVINLTDDKHPQIKGSIFSGERNNVTIDTVENRRAQFAGKNGEMTVITADSTSKFKF